MKAEECENAVCAPGCRRDAAFSRRVGNPSLWEEAVGLLEPRVCDPKL
jgi:hypothetical protein